MKVLVCVVLLFFSVLYSAGPVSAINGNATDVFTCKFLSRKDEHGEISYTMAAYDSLEAKLDEIERSLREVHSSLKEMKQYITKSEEKLIDLQKQIQAKENTLQNTKQNMSRSEEKLIEIETKIQAKDKTDQESMQNKTRFDDDSKVKLKELQTNINMLQNETMVIESKSIRSCKDISKIHSAKYSIYVRNDTLASVACEDAAFGGGWIIIQHRFNGQVDFYRTWAEYRDGFGSLDGEFWWGLKYLHQLTSARKYELLVEMKDYNGNYGYARYDRFKVGSEAQNFYLKVGNYSGTAGDSLFYSQDMEFTTKDSDNDKTKRVQCAEYHHGAWWHNYCTYANLNGPYTNVPAEKEAMFWYEFKNDNRPMAYTRMMIREIDP